MRVITGDAPVTLSFAPRPQFGAVPVGLQATDRGIRVTGSADPLVLVAPGLDWKITYVGAHPTATAVVNPDGTFLVELRAGSDDMTDADMPESERRAFTHEAWVHLHPGSLRRTSTPKPSCARR